jgi:hypothetical protein
MSIGTKRTSRLDAAGRGTSGGAATSMTAVTIRRR